MREENIRALLMRREYPALKVVLNSMNNVEGGRSIHGDVISHAGNFDQCVYPL